jgi:hypothetical protein
MMGGGTVVWREGYGYDLFHKGLVDIMTTGLDFDIGHTRIFRWEHLFNGGCTRVHIALRTFS